MSFLAPAFLAGFLAIAVPVLIHLINRERKVVVQFPSLMFLQRIPYRSVRRQKLRHLLLLALRCLAILLFAAGFARPFFAHRAATTGSAGARNVVILLDHSASMAFGSRWTSARSAAKKIAAGLGAGDHGTLVLFAGDASVASPPMAAPAQLGASVDAARLTSERTSFAPALKLASQILSASTLPRREVVLISDFQKSGWASHTEVSLPPGTTITPIDVSTAASPDVAIALVTTDRDSTGDRDRVTVAARLVNTGAAAASRSATLAVGGRDVQTRQTNVPAHAAVQVAFTPIVVPGGATKGAVRITPDSLAADDVFDFTIAPDAAVPALIVDPGTPRPDQSLYISRALAIGDRPAFHVSEKPVSALTPRDIDAQSLVILNEVAPPSGPIGARLRALLAAGGGIVVVPGGQNADAWPAEWRPLLPAAIGAVVDRTPGAGATLSSIDYANPIFEIFNAPHGGDFLTARFDRYRTLKPAAAARVIARFDDGAPALVEGDVGSGKMVVWASSIDKYWTNLPLQPVFLPFVHQLGKNVARYADPRLWFTAGDVLDLSRHGELTSAFAGARGADSTSELVLESPSGERERLSAGGANHLTTLREEGFYELRGPNTPVGSGRPIAVNVDPAELDLAHIDPRDVVTAVQAASAGTPAGAGTNTATPQDRERRQSVWWYLLLAALLLLALETTLSNRLSRATS
jgi:hypothetical protein